MAYDGLVTLACVTELKEKLNLGKIEKVYQPEKDELVFLVHGKSGNLKLFASVNPAHARVNLIDDNLVNPPNPSSFCMLMRKYLSGARIIDIVQVDSERIIEIMLETMNELGFTVSKKLVFEIMGKHSNVILVDLETGKIIDAIKHISFSESRLRQILPGLTYKYPPAQDKVPFKEATIETFEAIPDTNPKAILARIGGIAPGFAGELSSLGNAEAMYKYLRTVIQSILQNKIKPVCYSLNGEYKDFYFTCLNDLDESADKTEFETISQCIEFYFNHKETSNQGRQKSHDLIHQVSAILDKMYLKKARLSEDLKNAENSDNLRLYGELLTANLYMVKSGMKEVTVTNYYTGSPITIPLDISKSPEKNAQAYYKKYGKSKTAVKEKQIQIEENASEIEYLESVLTYLENTDSVSEIETLKSELVETGYIRYRKVSGFKEKKFKSEPLKYKLANGMTVLVGRNNRENDILTFKTAQKNDLWLHTKDVPGSHVIVQTGGIDISGTINGPVSGLSQAAIDKMEDKDVDRDAVMEAAAIAAYHSKGRDSQNVAVDYVPAKYVKKPNGAKPGMVIFTNNRTVYVDPKEPKNK